MKKVWALLVLSFCQISIATEGIGYPTGFVGCYKSIDIYMKIGGKREAVTCEKLQGIDYDMTDGKDIIYKPIFTYKKKINDREWYQIFTIKGEGRWVLTGNESVDDIHFAELDDVIKIGLYNFGPKWDQKIYEDPEKGRVSKVKEIPYEVEITKSEFFDGRLWVKINIYDGSKCINEGEKPPKVIHSGWVPFMRTNTESNFEKPFECG